ncbi:MAG TPA: 23S rRNA (cytosine(1962)-C(5))-methyltransferase RlmI, partial [Burkholderiales bacterium]|nr:23S rRNA (cytosine(1962)-C(5))-methyltransferase RlmI [Burkholderiales bacterium]
MDKLVLKPGREKSLKRRHPWVFSGAVAKVQGKPETGATVGVWSASGEFLAVAAYSPQSQIVARAWDWEERAVDEAFFRQRIEQAVGQRRALMGAAGAMRLIHAESDGLPGIVADRYGDTMVLQLNSAGAERWRET